MKTSKRRIAGQVVMLGSCVVLSTHAAWAGQWEAIPAPNGIYDVVNGMFSVEGQDYINGEPQVNEWEFDWVWASSPTGAGGTGNRWEPLGGYAWAENAGKRRTFFQWIPEHEGEPVPEWLTVRVIGGVSAHASSAYSEQAQHRSSDKEQVSGSIVIGGETGITIGASEVPFQIDLSGVAVAAEANHLARVKTNGQTIVAGPWVEYNSRAEVDGDRFIPPPSEGGEPTPIRGFVEAGGGGYQEYDPRSVSITSPTIEKSYYKQTFDYLLPRNDYGNVIQSKIRDTTPYNGPNSGPWAVECERLSDSFMEVHSAASWYGPNTFPAFSVGNWWGGGDFVANSTPSDSPPTTYQWSLNGGSAENDAETELNSGNSTIDLGISVNVPGEPGNAPQNSVDGINLGGAQNGTSMTNKSVLNLKATYSDGAIAQDKYTIWWHQPLEHKENEGVINSGQTLVSDASDWGVLERSIVVTIQPRSVWWDIAGHGTGIAAIAGTVLFPQGTLTTIGLAGLSGANYSITNLAPSAVNQSVSFSYAEYADAVIKQYNKNHGVPGTQNDQDTIFSENDPSGQRFIELVDRLYASLQLDGNGDGDAGQAGNDPNYKNLVYQSRISLVRKWHTEQWRGDYYNVNGFVKKLSYPISEEFQILKIPQVKVS